MTGSARRLRVADQPDRRPQGRLDPNIVRLAHSVLIQAWRDAHVGYRDLFIDGGLDPWCMIAGWPDARRRQFQKILHQRAESYEELSQQRSEAAKAARQAVVVHTPARTPRLYRSVDHRPRQEWRKSLVVRPRLTPRLPLLEAMLKRDQP